MIEIFREAPGVWKIKEVDEAGKTVKIYDEVFSSDLGADGFKKKLELEV